MKRNFRALALLMAVSIPSLSLASITFSTSASWSYNGPIHSQSDSSSNIGFPFISSTVDEGNIFTDKLKASALASVNGYIAVAASSFTYYRGQPKTEAQAEWTGNFTNPYLVPTDFDIDLSFGAGSLLATLGSYVEGWDDVHPFVQSDIAVFVNGVPVFSDQARIQKAGTILQFQHPFGTINWHQDASNSGLEAWGFDPFTAHLHSGLIDPSAPLVVTYGMILRTEHYPDAGFGAARAEGYLSDPFDINGNLRTEAPWGLGVTVTASTQAVPEPATMLVFGAGLLGVLRRRRAS